MKTIDEMLAKMWQSNEDFHNRFLGRPANFSEALYAYSEEFRELEQATIYSQSEWEISCEAADVLYTVIGVLRSRDIDLEMFLDAMQHVINKNNAKTHETHYINEHGKIQKKGRE